MNDLATLIPIITIFILAIFVGLEVIAKVPQTLHTPLMSVTNAISGIILVGGMLQLNGPPGSLMVILGASAILLATINIVGGFMVTQRMLRMFKGHVLRDLQLQPGSRQATFRQHIRNPLH